MDRPLHQYRKLVGIDIETWDGKNKGSLDPFTGKIALVQIAHDKNNIEILRFNENTKPYIKSILEDATILKIGHNLKFDLKFFYVNKIYPVQLFDTMIASEIIYAGLNEPDSISKEIEANKKYLEIPIEELFEIHAEKQTKATRFSHSLIAVLQRELNIRINKDVQNSNWGAEVLTDEQIEYAKNDVKYLIPLAKHFWRKIKGKSLEKVFYLETEFLRVLALLEIVGIKIDRDGWQKHIEKAKEELIFLEKELKKEIYEKFVLPKKATPQASLFNDYDIESQSINLNSPLQMMKIFGLHSTSKLVLEKISDPTIQKYIEYRKHAKLVSTYSKEYLEKLDKRNRLHSDYSQTKTATGRISSSNPNLQNVPPWFKRYIIAEEGFVPVFADYSQVELRILAYLSGDEEFIRSCEAKDMHSENARKIFKIPPDQPVPKDLRKKAKTVSFAIPYGSSAIGLVQRGMFESVEEAEYVMKEFFSNFPKVKEFLEQCAESAANGLTRDAIGRIRNYDYTIKHQFQKYEAAYELILPKIKNFRLDPVEDFVKIEDYKSFCQMYPNLKERISEKEFNIVKKFFETKSKLNRIKREGQNHPIQATSASITKKAMVDLFYYLLSTGYGYMTLTVHDSIFFEVKKDKIFPAILEIKEIMEYAGSRILPGAKTPVDIEVGRKVDVICSKCQQVFETNEYYVDLKEKVFLHISQIDLVCEECKS